MNIVFKVHLKFYTWKNLQFKLEKFQGRLSNIFCRKYGRIFRSLQEAQKKILTWFKLWITAWILPPLMFHYSANKAEALNKEQFQSGLRQDSSGNLVVSWFLATSFYPITGSSERKQLASLYLKLSNNRWVSVILKMLTMSPKDLLCTINVRSLKFKFKTLSLCHNFYRYKKNFS